MSIKFRGVKIKGVLNDTKTAEKIFNVLPIRARGERWGGEFYFEIAVAEELEDGKKEVERGDIAYWPPGRALCLFWGPTPISSGGRIIPASEVTIVGKMEGDLELFNLLEDGDEVEIVRA
ncbi:MAG: hypothetical protein J7M13_03950 [Synergistetes bacterium]|nr:hypothetical protein [Synergistota bacterium]